MLSPKQPLSHFVASSYQGMMTKHPMQCCLWPTIRDSTVLIWAGASLVDSLLLKSWYLSWMLIRINTFVICEHLYRDHKESGCGEVAEKNWWEESEARTRRKDSVCCWDTSVSGQISTSVSWGYKQAMQSGLEAMVRMLRAPVCCPSHSCLLIISFMSISSKP